VYNGLEMASSEVTDSPEGPGKNTSHSYARYIVAMALEVILLYVFNNLLHNYISTLAPYVSDTYPRFIVNIIDTIAGWHVPYFTDAFTSCLWAVNTALGFAIVANLVLLLYHPKWFHHLAKGLIFALAVLPVYIVFKTFPFEFSNDTAASATKVILIIVQAGMALGFIIEIILFALALFHKIRNNKEKIRRSPEDISGPKLKEVPARAPEEYPEPIKPQPPPQAIRGLVGK
jgi:hypothetical protein